MNAPPANKLMSPSGKAPAPPPVKGNDVVVTDPGGGTVEPSGTSVLDVVSVALVVVGSTVDGEISMLVGVEVVLELLVLVEEEVELVLELLVLVEVDVEVDVDVLVEVASNGTDVVVLVEVDVEVDVDVLVIVEMELEVELDELVPSSVVDVLDDDVEDVELLDDDDDDEEEEEDDDDGPVDAVVGALDVSQLQNCLDDICTGGFPRGDDMNCAYCGPAHFTPCKVTKTSCPGASA